MGIQRYSVTHHPVEVLLSWVKSGEIAIPEIQRPFVWDAAKVRNLLDSLYNGYPVGYLIIWRNPTIKLKDGTLSGGKRILIDGQQRVTALMASLLGHEVLNKDYEKIRIRIAFHPKENKFEVTNPAIAKDVTWIDDISKVFAPDASIYSLVNDYCSKNPDMTPDEVHRTLERLRKISNNSVGIIELAEDLDIETVTEIFIRVNSAGTALSQADFVMSKIAVNETYGGNVLRKAIDYFSHLAVNPEFLSNIEKNDETFVKSEFFPKMQWIAKATDDIYEPSYTDMLRVAFTSEFSRGRLQDLVALLSGRNFETKLYEDAIAEESFAKLKNGILAFINQTSFERFVMALRSAGFITSRLIGGTNAINFSYIMYLRGREEKLAAHELESLVRRWYVMSALTGRYTGSPETQFDLDIRQINSQGALAYANSVIENEFSDTYWTGMLPQLMITSSVSSPYFHCFQAAQIKLGDRGFLSRDITVRDLLLNNSDRHHLYPRKYLQSQGMTRGRYNQIANFVVTQAEINRSIGATPPEVYFQELLNQVRHGVIKYGGIDNKEDLLENLRENCIPETLLHDAPVEYDDFLEQRRKLMALKIKEWFKGL